jgi:hypothetical protein
LNRHGARRSGRSNRSPGDGAGPWRGVVGRGTR